MRWGGVLVSAQTCLIHSKVSCLFSHSPSLLRRQSLSCEPTPRQWNEQTHAEEEVGPVRLCSFSHVHLSEQAWRWDQTSVGVWGGRQLETTSDWQEREVVSSELPGEPWDLSVPVFSCCVLKISDNPDVGFSDFWLIRLESEVEGEASSVSLCLAPVWLWRQKKKERNDDTKRCRARPWQHKTGRGA